MLCSIRGSCNRISKIRIRIPVQCGPLKKPFHSSLPSTSTFTTSRKSDLAPVHLFEVGFAFECGPPGAVGRIFWLLGPTLRGPSASVSHAPDIRTLLEVVRLEWPRQLIAAASTWAARDGPGAGVGAGFFVGFGASHLWLGLWRWFGIAFNRSDNWLCGGELSILWELVRISSC